MSAQPRAQRLESALAALRSALDLRAYGFPSIVWTRQTDEGRRRAAVLTAGGHFIGESFTPGRRQILEASVHVPAELYGVSIGDEELCCELFSRFPLEVTCDDEVVFACGDPPNSRGRALFTVVPRLVPGQTHRLRVEVAVPDELIAYGLTMQLAPGCLRELWHEADANWGKLLLSARLDPCHSVLDIAPIPDPTEIAPLHIGGLSRVLEQLAQWTSPVVEGLRLPPVGLVAYAHVDVEWLWDWDATKRAFRGICATARRLLDGIDEFRVSISQGALYDALTADDPTQLTNIRDRVQRGQWEALPSTWVEPDYNLISGESIVRQLLVGRNLEQALGGGAGVCIAADSFGHPASLPQLLVQAGQRAFYHARCDPIPGHHGGAYRWRGIDGSEILALTSDDYSGPITPSRIVFAALAAYSAGLSVAPLFCELDGHGGEAFLDAERRLGWLRSEPWFPECRWTTFGEIVASLDREGLPVFEGAGPTIFEGSYTNVVRSKQLNQQAESRLIDAEMLTCMAGLDRREDLDRTWKAVLLTQFHDAVTGTSKASSHHAQHTRVLAAIKGLDAMTSDAVCCLTATARGDLAIVNPLPRERVEWIELVSERMSPADRVRVGRICTDDGRSVPYQALEGTGGFVVRLPASSVTGITLQPSGPEDDDQPLICGEQQSARVHAGEENRKRFFTISSPFYSLTLRGDAGAIVSLRQRDCDDDLVAFGMKKPTTMGDTARPELALNVLQLVHERPHVMTAWNVHEVHKEESLLTTGTTTWVERGPLRVVLRTEHVVGSSRISQYLTSYRDLPRIDVRLEVDWQERGTEEAGVPGLKVAFTPKLPGSRLVTAIPYGAVEVDPDGQERPMHRWFDVSNEHAGIAVITTDRYGYDALGPRTRISLVRSAYDPSIDVDLGRHTFSYSLLPHHGGWKQARVPLLAQELAQPPVVVPLSYAAGRGREPAVSRLPWIDPDGGGMITAAKLTGDGTDLVLRVVEWAGEDVVATIRGFPAGVRCYRTRLTEERIERLRCDDGVLRLQLAAWAVETVVVEGWCSAHAAK